MEKRGVIDENTPRPEAPADQKHHKEDSVPTGVTQRLQEKAAALASAPVKASDAR